MTSEGRGLSAHEPHRSLALFAAAQSHLDALDDLLLTDPTTTPLIKEYLNGLSRHVREGFRESWDGCEGTVSRESSPSTTFCDECGDHIPASDFPAHRKACVYPTPADVARWEETATARLQSDDKAGSA